MAKIGNNQVIPCDPSKPNSTQAKVLMSDNGTQYAFCNLNGRLIYAGENTAVYEHPTAKTPRYGVAKGKPIGVLTGYLDYGTHVFLTFLTQKNELGKIVFLKNKTIADSFLKKDKVKTKQQQQDSFDEVQEDENKSWYEKLTEDLSEGLLTTVKWTAIAGGAYLLFKESNKSNTAVTGAKKKKRNQNLIFGGLAALALYKYTQKDEKPTTTQSKQANANSTNSSRRTQQHAEF